MRRKTIIIILTSLLILTTGCININVAPQEQQKTSSTDTPKQTTPQVTVDTSKLDVNKIALTDTEIKEVLGTDWTKRNASNRGGRPDIQLFMTEYYNPNTYLKNTPDIALILIIAPNTTMVKQALDNTNIQSSRDFGNIQNISDFDIGESGKLIKSKGNNNVDLTIIVFNINTILVETISSTDQETTIKFAKKQEAKINNIIQSLN
jgi:hypothetical protein